MPGLDDRTGGASPKTKNNTPTHTKTQHRADANAAEAARVLTAGGRLVVTSPGAPPRVVGAAGAARYRASMVTR